MNVFVFLGPSLPLEEAREILNAEFLGPVKMGDVQTLIPRNPSTICIIDGYFERVPSVWHKEILYALSCGIRKTVQHCCPSGLASATCRDALLLANNL